MFSGIDKSRLRIDVDFRAAQRWAVDQVVTQGIRRDIAIQYVLRIPDQTLEPSQKQTELACQIGGNAVIIENDNR